MSAELIANAGLGRWTKQKGHRDWLTKQADNLFDFFQRGFVDHKDGFYDLDITGRPLNPNAQVHPIHISARAVHCYAIAALLGRPGARAIVDHGMDFLWNYHRDKINGGYFWSVKDGPFDSNKQGYGHAFVLLAAASAKLIDHPLADAMLADITQILDTKFWEEEHGAAAEEFTVDWQPIEGSNYRGQNSNMHLAEALMAAFEAIGDVEYLRKAKLIANRVIRKAAGSLGWRVGEHFHRDWAINREYYHSNEMFRPAGTTPGHSLEWARLVLQLWVLDGKQEPWMPQAAKNLFSQAMKCGWDKTKGGFFYTLDWNDAPSKRSKLWWPACEGVAAAHFLNELCPDPIYELVYRKIWDFIAQHFIDQRNGGWNEELTEDLSPSYGLFPGKGDIYHSLQA